MDVQSNLVNEQPHVVRRSSGDYFLVVLAIVLAGYAIFGKTFANLGIAPLYVGELTLIFGIYAFIRSRAAIATLASLPHLLLATLMCLVVASTILNIAEHGIDALRDSVIILYGGFSFIITALLLANPQRLFLPISFLRLISNIIVPIAPVLVLMGNASYFSLTGEYELSYVRPDSLAVHLAAAALLALLGFRRAHVVWVMLLTVGMIAIASQSRGGMLAFILMISVAVVATGNFRLFGRIAVVAIALISIAYVLDLSMPTPRGRDISATQVLENFGSIFQTTNENLDATKQWRQDWWQRIYSYTFEGPYFWTGKGFGVNLTIDDGIISPATTALVPLLRSPHNSHLTILARTGIPGVALWLLLITSWGALVLTNVVRARWRGDVFWSNFFLLTFCYGLGFLVEAAFDVVLEGPMDGIWFWCVFGVGVGASLIYAAESQRHGAVRDLEYSVSQTS
jgi:O-antigen ligase/polysaccharide polymerase Wzy-like membrane protein